MNTASQFATYWDSFGSSAIDEFSLAGVILIYIIGLFIWAGVYVLYSYMLSRIFRKAGLEAWKVQSLEVTATRRTRRILVNTTLYTICKYDCIYLLLHRPVPHRT
jgi:hypothetical protein